MSGANGASFSLSQWVTGYSPVIGGRYSRHEPSRHSTQRAADVQGVRERQESQGKLLHTLATLALALDLTCTKDVVSQRKARSQRPLLTSEMGLYVC